MERPEVERRVIRYAGPTGVSRAAMTKQTATFAISNGSFCAYGAFTHRKGPRHDESAFQNEARARWDMEDVYSAVGKRLREARTRRGLTQQGLAEQAGISSTFLSLLESGGRKGSLETYHRLAAALDIDFGDLTKGRFGEMPRQAGHTLTLQGLRSAERQAVYRLVKAFKKPK